MSVMVRVEARVTVVTYYSNGGGALGEGGGGGGIQVAVWQVELGFSARFFDRATDQPKPSQGLFLLSIVLASSDLLTTPAS